MLTPYKATRACGLLLSCLLATLVPASAAKPDPAIAARLRSVGIQPPLPLALLTTQFGDGLPNSVHGDGDGVLEPGETARLEVTLSNDGPTPLNGVTGLLLADSAAPFVRILDDRALWPLLAAHDGTASASFQIEISPDAPCGARIELALQLTDGASSSLLLLEQTLGRRWAGPAFTLSSADRVGDGKNVVLIADNRGFAAVVPRIDETGAHLALLRLSTSGSLLGTTDLPSPAHALPNSPALAWNGSEYGLAFSHRAEGNEEIYFQRISADGRLLGDATRVTNNDLTSFDVKLVWHATVGWVAAWREGDQTAQQLKLVTIDADGQTQGTPLEIADATFGYALAAGPHTIAVLATNDHLNTSWFVRNTHTSATTTLPWNAPNVSVGEQLIWNEATQEFIGARSYKTDGTVYGELARMSVDGQRLGISSPLTLGAAAGFTALAADDTQIQLTTWELHGPDQSEPRLFRLDPTLQTAQQLELPDSDQNYSWYEAVALGHGFTLYGWSKPQQGVFARLAYASSTCAHDDPSKRTRGEPDAPEILCNGIDDDSNPSTLDAPDADADTFDVCGPGDIVNPDGKAADCNDARNDVYPGALEFCDGVDNDCDASTDEVTGTRYIAPTGSDSNNLCTVQGTPCLTFNHAIHAACVNATVFAAVGTYNQSVTVDKKVIIDNSGLSSATFVQGSGTGDVVTILTSGVIWDGVEVRGGGSNAACLRIGNASTPNLRGVEVGNAAFYNCAQGIVIENTGNDPTFLGINRMTQVDCRENLYNGSADSGLGLMTVGVNGRLEIKGGNFRNNASSGIRFTPPVSGTSTNMLVNGAIIESNGLAASSGGRAGIEVLTGADVRIEGNDIFGHTGNGAGDDGRGVVLDNVSSGFIACTRLRNNDTGVELKGGTTSFDVLHNRINNNGVRGMLVGASTGTGLKLNETVFTGNAAGVLHQGTGTLDLKHNWWGAANGPSGAGGSGNSVSGSVDVSNFIARADEPVLVRGPVDSGWAYPNAACYDIIQNAINATPAGSLLLIGAGNPFHERLTLNKALNLEGVPSPTAGACPLTDIYGDQGGTVKPALRITNVAGISVKYLTIHAAGENTPACNTHSGDEIGLDLQNVDNSTFTDLCLQENGITEIRLYGDSDGNTFQRVNIDGQLCIPGNGCLCSHRSRYGYLIDGAPVCEAGPGAIANNNRILDSSIKNVTQGLSLRLAAGTEITNNTIEPTTTPTWDGGTLAIGVNIKAADDTVVQNSTIGNSTETEGIRLAGKAASDCFTEELNADRSIIRDNTIRTASGPGVYFKRTGGDPGNALSTTVRCNDITQNGTGVQAEDPSAASPTTVTLNDIRTNSAGVRNLGVDSLSAVRNWWGSASGPSGNGPGTGDSALGSVDFANWLASPSKNDADNDTFTECAGDCNDANIAIKPGAAELCNQLDDDCDGSVDEGLPLNTYYRDADGDTFGNAAVTTQACGSAPSGYVANNTDCDDAVASINPGAAEIYCDNIDQRCNGAGDETPDQDNDTFDVCGPVNVLNPDGKVADCSDLNPSAYPGALEVICNGVDEACNGGSDEAPDGDSDGADRCGFADPFNPDTFATDCDDANPNRAPQLAELCDLIDNDCDNTVDEGFSTSTYFRDNDSDTFGTTSTTQQACIAPPGYVTSSTDCNDSNPAINPGAVELCNDNLDNDCDASIDVADSSCASLDVSNLRFQTGGKVTLTWDNATSASSYALYRGTVREAGITPYDHRSLYSELPSATAQDAQVPAPSSAFYYLATGLSKNGTTGEIVGGPLGNRSDNTSRPESSIASAGPRVYVNPDAVGAGTGLSWADGYTTVSGALGYTKARSRGVEIWVKGTINNDGGTSITDSSRAGAVILGGFAGTETSAWQRNPTVNVSTWKGGSGKALLTATRTGVVIDGMTLDTGTDAVVVTAPGGGIELRGVTITNFTANAVDITVDGMAGASLIVDASSFDAASQRGIHALVNAGTLSGSIRANTFTGSSTSAIHLEANPTAGDAVIATQLVRNVVNGGARGVWLSARADDDGFTASVTGPVLSNLIRSTTVEAMRVEALGAFTSFAGTTSALANLPIIGNTLVDGADGLVCTVTRTDSTASPSSHTVSANPTVWNNLITHMSGAGISESSDNAAANLTADPVVITNDLFSATPLYRDEGSSSLTISQVNALSGNSGNTSQDPLYVNRAAFDYHLQSGSPVIDGGRDDAPSKAGEDFEGDQRQKDAKPDLGADER